MTDNEVIIRTQGLTKDFKKLKAVNNGLLVYPMNIWN